MLSAEDQQILKTFEFISYVTYGGNDYIGVIQNADEFVSIYDFSVLKSKEQKARFLVFAEQWWWESNRTLIPINIFLKKDWEEFRICLKTFNSKDVVIQFGPHMSLKEVALRRPKRKSITLVRRV